MLTISEICSQEQMFTLFRGSGYCASSQDVTAWTSKKSTYSQPNIATVTLAKKSELRTKSANLPLAALRAAVGGIEAGAIGKCSTPNGWAIFAPLMAGRGAQKRSLSHRRFLIGVRLQRAMIGKVQFVPEEYRSPPSGWLLA